MQLPTASGVIGENQQQEDDHMVIDEPPDLPYSTPVEIVDEMISLSGLPKSRWQTLLNLEAIKKRNKPKEAPKAPEKAPFFLPTLAGPTPKFLNATTSKVEDATMGKASKVVRIADMEVLTEFSRLLRECDAQNDCKKTQ